MKQLGKNFDLAIELHVEKKKKKKQPKWPLHIWSSSRLTVRPSVFFFHILSAIL